MGYTKGLHEVADGVWAYLQPDGGWGWSNAGLITGDGTLPPGGHAVRPAPHRRDARGRCAAHTRRPHRIATVVNTHANGDHCYGNALLA